MGSPSRLALLLAFAACRARSASPSVRLAHGDPRARELLVRGSSHLQPAARASIDAQTSWMKDIAVVRFLSTSTLDASGAA